MDAVEQVAKPLEEIIKAPKSSSRNLLPSPMSTRGLVRALTPFRPSWQDATLIEVELRPSFEEMLVTLDVGTILSECYWRHHTARLLPSRLPWWHHKPQRYGDGTFSGLKMDGKSFKRLQKS